MNARITNKPSSPSGEVKFRIRPALAAAVCCAALAFVTGQFVGVLAGVEFAVRTVAAIHFALASGIVGGFSTIMFAMDDKEVTAMPTTPPLHAPRATAKRAA